MHFLENIEVTGLNVLFWIWIRVMYLAVYLSSHLKKKAINLKKNIYTLNWTKFSFFHFSTITDWKLLFLSWNHTWVRKLDLETFKNTSQKVIYYKCLFALYIMERIRFRIPSRMFFFYCCRMVPFQISIDWKFHKCNCVFGNRYVNYSLVIISAAFSV